MAIFTPGPLVAAISGNVAGINFVAGRPTRYVRPALGRVNKRTSPQLQRRARFLQVIRTWTEIGQAQRLEWITAAKQITSPNRLGIPRTISGFQFFVKVNLQRVDSYAITTSPPQTLTRGPAPTHVTITASAAAGVYVSWHQPIPPGSAHAYFFGARSTSSKPTAQLIAWRFLSSHLGTGGPNAHTITAEWDQILGHPVQHELIAIRIGIYSDWRLFSFYVQALGTCGA